MSYEPTQWKAGDTVTSAKLNKLEQGVATIGGVLIVHIVDNGENPATLDKTWQEIYDIGCGIVIEEDTSNNTKSTGIIGDIYYDGNAYSVNIARFDIDPNTVELIPVRFIADSPNDYPRIGPNK